MAESYEITQNFKDKFIKNEEKNNLDDEDGGEWHKVTNERRKNISSQVRSIDGVKFYIFFLLYDSKHLYIISI